MKLYLATLPMDNYEITAVDLSPEKAAETVLKAYKKEFRGWYGSISKAELETAKEEISIWEMIPGKAEWR